MADAEKVQEAARREEAARLALLEAEAAVRAARVAFRQATHARREAEHAERFNRANPALFGQG